VSSPSKAYFISSLHESEMALRLDQMTAAEVTLRHLAACAVLENSSHVQMFGLDHLSTGERPPLRESSYSSYITRSLRQLLDAAL
jgi:hypothetical protein